MAKGQEPSAPAVAQLRHLVEYEPDGRQLFWVSYPTTGGKYRSPNYGENMEIRHPRVLPEPYRLEKLANLWEGGDSAQSAFETDGIQPKEGFTMYLIGVAMIDADRAMPGFGEAGAAASSLLVVVADGWNHSTDTPDRIDMYKRIKAELLDTATVGI